MSTETAAVVFPSAVAALAIVAGWHQHLRGLKLQRGFNDLDNVRGVLEAAAVALHEVAYCLDDVRSYLTQHGGVAFFKTDEGADTYKHLGGHGRELDALVERLAIRFGREHDVTTAFSEVDEAVLGIWRVAGLLRLEREADGDGSAATQIRRLNEEKRTEIDALREKFDSARHRFLDAAHASAGSAL